ncbi:hypothetical protein D3C73_388390 [compost metagenome]
MLDRAIDAVNDRDRNHRIQIFRAPVFFRRRCRRRAGKQDFDRSADLAAGILERLQKRHEMRTGNGLVHQQRFGRAADTRASHLGIHDDIFCHVEIGTCVDIDMAEAFEMRKDRYSGLVLHAGDKALAAARNDDVYRTI